MPRRRTLGVNQAIKPVSEEEIEAEITRLVRKLPMEHPTRATLIELEDNKFQLDPKPKLKTKDSLGHFQNSELSLKR
jgi:hypothetical protein